MVHSVSNLSGANPSDFVTGCCCSKCKACGGRSSGKVDTGCGNAVGNDTKRPGKKRFTQPTRTAGGGGVFEFPRRIRRAGDDSACCRCRWRSRGRIGKNEMTLDGCAILDLLLSECRNGTKQGDCTR